MSISEMINTSGTQVIILKISSQLHGTVWPYFCMQLNMWFEFIPFSWNLNSECGRALGGGPPLVVAGVNVCLAVCVCIHHPAMFDSLQPRDCGRPGSSSTAHVWFIVVVEWVFACMRMHRTGNRFLFWGKSVGKRQVSVLQFLDILELSVPETRGRTLEAGLVSADRGGAASHGSAFWLGSVMSAAGPDAGSWAGRPRGHPQARRSAGETWREERREFRSEPARAFRPSDAPPCSQGGRSGQHVCLCRILKLV